jgi:hypothetical protein
MEIYYVIAAFNPQRDGKFDPKWKGPFQVVGIGESSNHVLCKDLCTQVVHPFDISTLRLFHCPPDIDPVTIAGMDEDEFLVKSILSHRLEGEKKKNKTHYYFEVLFADGTKDWLPYMEVKDLEAFGVYLQSNPELVKLLKLKLG